MINMLRALMRKVDNMEEQMNNKSRDGNSKTESEKYARKNQIKCCTRMKNSFAGLISSVGIAEERISELENVTIETFKTKKQRKKQTDKQKNNPKLLDNYK